MDESTIKAMKLLDERDEAERKTRVIRDISVEGFETCSLQRYAVKLALLKHFASCGKILSVPVFKSIAFIRFDGEGAQEKALELDGTDVGGWTAIVKPATAEFNLPSYAVGIKWSKLFISGYDTGLAEIDIKIALCNHFSSCGEVTNVAVPPSGRAIITIGGERSVEKALELSGRKVGEMNLVVQTGKRETEVRKSRRLIDENACGYALGSYRRVMAKMEKEKMEKEKVQMKKVQMEMKKVQMEMKKVQMEMEKEKMEK